MKKTRRKFSVSFKAKVAIEGLNGQSRLQVRAAKFKLQPTRILN